MTKEQAIKHLKLMQSGARNAIRFTKNNKEISEEERKEDIEIYQDQLEALNIAIQELEQQPCDDCVSRAEIKKIAKEMYLEVANMDLDVHTISDCISYTSSKCRQVLEDKLQTLPPVTPTHGMCKDCARSKKLNDFEGHSIVCSRFGRMAVNPDFYCADYEKAR